MQKHLLHSLFFFFSIFLSSQASASFTESLCRRLLIESPRHFRLPGPRELPKGIAGVAISWVEWLLGAKTLSDRFQEAYELSQSQGISLPEAAMLVMEIDIRLKHIRSFDPQLFSGRSVIFIAQHPIGAIDGLIGERIAETLLPDKDIRTVLTKYMRDQNIPGIDEAHYIFVDPKGGDKALNLDGTKKMVAHLKEKNTLIIFPAGDISNLDFSTKTPVDRAWNPSFISFAKKQNALIVPLRFENLQNPSIFYRQPLTSVLGPTLWRDAMTPRSLLSHTGAQVDVSVLAPIDVSLEPWASMSAEALALELKRQSSRDP